MSRIGELAARIPPDARIRNAAHRGLLGSAAPLVNRRRGDEWQRIARAMRATARGRFSPGEREWIARIEARRQRAAAEWKRSAAGTPASGGEGLWAPPFLWSMPRIWARFLMRLVGELEPRRSIELGSGFGVSALYQGAALELLGSGSLDTLDREPTLMPIAARGFRELGLDRRITLTSGAIGSTLDEVAARLAPIDYALIDAEHTETATVHNFDALRPHLADRAVVVVDDIRMDAEMRRAWETIRERPGNLRTFSLRRLGLVVNGTPA